MIVVIVGPNIENKKKEKEKRIDKVKEYMMMFPSRPPVARWTLSGHHANALTLAE
jgi:hypothetical protein